MESDASESEPEDEQQGETLYGILYCAPSADETQLRQAYKQQALHWHPDKNDDPEAEASPMHPSPFSPIP